MTKTAIITGLRGQDGSYLAEILLEKGFKVYGLIRRSSSGLDLGNASHLQNNPLLEVVEGDITDLVSMANLEKLAKPDLFLHMAAQSHVATSFEQPNYTIQSTGIGTFNCLEAIKQSGYHTRFLNAATSELFGGISNEPCNENTPFHPRSPYAVSKAFGYYITQFYREAYKMFACSTICFNHEGPRRTPTFVTRKISLAASRIKLGLQDKLYLGNLETKRDWGYAKDYCNAMIRILTECPFPKDYVLATGETYTVREFCKLAFARLDLDYTSYVEVDPSFYRPAEVNVLVGNSNLIYTDLKWKPSISFLELVNMMVDHDFEQEAAKHDPSSQSRNQCSKT